MEAGCIGLDPLDLQRGGETHGGRTALSLVPAWRGWEMHPKAWASGHSFGLGLSLGYCPAKLLSHGQQTLGGCY